MGSSNCPLTKLLLISADLLSLITTLIVVFSISNAVCTFAKTLDTLFSFKIQVLSRLTLTCVFSSKSKDEFVFKVSVKVFKFDFDAVLFPKYKKYLLNIF